MYFELCLWFEGNYNQIKQKTKAKWETIIKKYNNNAVSFVVFKGENWIGGGKGRCCVRIVPSSALLILQGNENGCADNTVPSNHY